MEGISVSDPTAASSTPPWRGFHHLALVTPDLEATRAFYGSVLGMDVGEILTRGGLGGRHCFVKPGAFDGWGIHFFEHVEAQVFAYPLTAPTPVFVPGALQHIAFGLPDQAAAYALRERLRKREIECFPTGLPGPMGSMIFFDNNGSMLEATWPRPEEPERLKK
jgi:catechol 2,3-dioxygenase-like lactoylglutathione lyase family enzyme